MDEARSIEEFLFAFEMCIGGRLEPGDEYHRPITILDSTGHTLSKGNEASESWTQKMPLFYRKPKRSSFSYRKLIRAPFLIGNLKRVLFFKET